MIKTEEQIVRKIKSILKSYGEVYEDWKNVFYNEGDINFQRVLEGELLKMKGELKIVKWVTGISYKQYVPAGVIIIGD